MHRSRLPVVALLSMSVIALEVLWTRILSAEFFYTFAFLILSLAILGLGLGALSIRLFPRLAQPRDPSISLVLATVLGLVGPAAVVRLGLHFATLYRSPAMIGKLVVALLLLGAPFFFAGIALTRIFRAHHDEMPRLYMADLAGAGLGALLAVVAMNTVQVPLAAIVACVPFALAAILLSGKLRAVHAAMLALVLVAGACAWWLVAVPRRELGPVAAQHWDALGRIKVHAMSKEWRNLNIENVANSPVIGFDGDIEKARSEEPQFLFHLTDLLGGRTGFVMASLGSGGGSEVLQGLIEDAGEIHAVEVNPAINRMMTEGDLADFSGRIYHDPRVRVVSEDGRAYLRRFSGHFDVILSSSSNTWASLASGAFALSENYLFTTEAFVDYLQALAPGGYLAMEHQFYIPRVVSEALDALRIVGVDDPTSHIAVYQLPKRRREVILISKQPLSRAAIDALMGPLTEERAEQVRLLYPDGDDDSLSARIARNGWRQEADAARFDISPCTDDRPFVAQMGRFRNLSWTAMEKLLPYEFTGFPVAKLVVLTILAVILVLVLPLLLLPAMIRGDRLGAAPWLYFFAIGVGFMAVEVVLMQQFTLLVGSSAYTFVAILVALLLASGLGSRMSRRFGDAFPFLAIAAWLLLDIALFPAVVRALGGLPAGARILAAVVLVLPLGFFMGMPFPKAALRVRELVDWGFAVNGVASVIGSTAIVLVAITSGFRVALAVAAAFYLLALLLLRRRWSAPA